MIVNKQIKYFFSNIIIKKFHDILELVIEELWGTVY